MVTAAQEERGRALHDIVVVYHTQLLISVCTSLLSATMYRFEVTLEHKKKVFLFYCYYVFTFSILNRGRRTGRSPIKLSFPLAFSAPHTVATPALSKWGLVSSLFQVLQHSVEIL